MRIVFLPFFLIVKLNVIMENKVYSAIITERDNLLHKEVDMMLGNDIILSDSEKEANQIIMNLKNREIEDGFENPKYFTLSQHFFNYKDSVKETELFKLIQDMPKGAVLHVHDTGILSPDYVVQLTYMDYLYVCFEGDNIEFKFSKTVPLSTCETQWQLLKHVRNSWGDVKEFDANLRKYFTIVIDNPTEVYTDVNTVWDKFSRYFINSGGLFSYKPVWEKYFYDTLKAFRSDNVMYVEMRSLLPSLYDLEGNIYDSVATAKSYKKVLDQFMQDYPDFFGAKLIYAPLRLVDKKTVAEYIDIVKQIKEVLPDFLAGFDLVGQEDLGVPTKEFISELTALKGDLDCFFHAGETNWYGTSSDENLADAIVLGTKRIGHAFALVKHPLLMEEVKKRRIALEVNVISNSVLKLVDDVRNHPLATFLARDLPVVLSSDDPGVWEADPLSHDFYVAFVGVASKRADLRVLKKLALNSLYYSSYHDKKKILKEFEIRWMKFIDSVLKNK